MRPLPLLTLMLGVSAAYATAAEADKTTRVEGTIVVPAEVAAFDGRLADIRLYKIHPMIADKSADLVEQVQLKDYAHTRGKETRTAFVIGAKGTLEPQMKYYITLFLLRDGKRTHMGKDARGKFLCTVLTHGQPREVTLIVREVRRR